MQPAERRGPVPWSRQKWQLDHSVDSRRLGILLELAGLGRVKPKLAGLELAELGQAGSAQQGGSGPLAVRKERSK